MSNNATPRLPGPTAPPPKGKKAPKKKPPAKGKKKPPKNEPSFRVADRRSIWLCVAVGLLFSPWLVVSFLPNEWGILLWAAGVLGAVWAFAPKERGF